MWEMVAVRGQLYGNRPMGYQEILLGAAYHCPVENPHAAVLDFLSQQPAYQGQLAAFAS